MAPKPKASSKKAAPAKAATKAAPNLFNQPSAPKKPGISKPKYTIKGTQVSSNVPALRSSTLPAAKAKSVSSPKAKNVTAAKAKNVTAAKPKNLPVLRAKMLPAVQDKPVAKSLATRLGSALKGKGKAGLIGGLLAAGAAAGYSAYNRGTGTTKKKAAETAPKDAAPVSIIKDYNRRDEIGKPSSSMVLKKADEKPAASASKPAASKGGPKSKGSGSKAAPKRPEQIALVKGITAKDIKPSTSATIGKPEVKSVTFAKAPTTSAASESKPKYSQKRIERMENRAERKAERMENRAERLEKRAGKLKGKLKYGGAVKAKNGKSFPDLNKDGKITKADILKGRGVIAKKGASVRKAGFGDILGKVAGSGALGLAGMAANKLFGGKKKAAPAMGGAPMATPAVAPMKKGGKIAAKKKMMKSGGKMGKCKYGCN